MAASTRDAIASPPDPTPLQLKQIAAGDEDACRTLIDGWEKPITIIASGYAGRRSDRDDLEQVGRIAVYAAALKYQITKGFPFSHYAKRAIKNRVQKEASRLNRQRLFENPLVDENEDVLTGFAIFSDVTHRVTEWVNELPEPHATLFRTLYVEGLRQRGVAAELGVSQAWVSLSHRSLLDLARVALGD